ncbi:MAG TPA: hypothetical protein VGQ57_11380 [Polyangiaceae bacterium]|jgi:hypothetical protein|nr:hypothetical protein [Polyangiaceae bacterium]
MLNFGRFGVALGSHGPAAGSRATAALLLAIAALAAGCGNDDTTRMLPPSQVAMNPDVTPVLETDEMSIYEVKKGLQFPIKAPDRTMPSGNYVPYAREPWVQLSDVRVQLTWTLSNLDTQAHNVELLIDPWTEFGRYWPGLTLVDPERGEYQPNNSGIDYYYRLEGTGAGDKSRARGTYTYDDMDELARDFATVMNLIRSPPTGYPGGQPVDPADQASLLPSYVNHAFDFENHSNTDLLLKPWAPGTVAGLTGVDFGLRTYEKATVSVELVLEITDEGSGKVIKDGAKDPALPATTEIITVGTAGPAM